MKFEKLSFGEKLEFLRGKKFQTIDIDKITCIEKNTPEALAIEPIVSVGVLVYNYGDFLPQALDSIIAQKTNFPFEIVVSNDFSTDNTAEILADYQRRYPALIRILNGEHNVGLTANTIRTILHSRGKYYAWCDADDYWLDEHKLQKQYDLFSQNANLGVVWGSGEVLQAEQYTPWHFPPQEKNGHNQRKYLFDLLERGFLTSSLMLRRDSLKCFIYESKLGQFLLMCNDCPFIADICFRQGQDFYCLEDKVTCYRIHNQSITNSYSWIQSKQDATMANNLGYWGDDILQSSHPQHKRFCKTLFSYSLSRSCHEKDLKKILISLIHAWQLHCWFTPRQYLRWAYIYLSLLLKK